MLFRSQLGLSDIANRSSPVQLTSGVIPYSGYFNGATYFSAGISVPITTGPFTIEAWVYPTGYNAQNTIVENAYWQIGQNAGFAVGITAAGLLYLNASTGTYNVFPTVMTATTAISLNVWTHVVVARDSSDYINMYINGVSAGTPVLYSASLNL